MSDSDDAGYVVKASEVQLEEQDTVLNLVAASAGRTQSRV